MKLRTQLTNETARLVEELFANPGVLAFLRAKPHPSMDTLKMRILGLLFNTSKWDGLYYALAASGDSHREIVALAGNHIMRWIDRFNRSSAQPTQEQLANISAVLAHAPPAVERQIRFFIGPKG